MILTSMELQRNLQPVTNVEGPFLAPSINSCDFRILIVGQFFLNIVSYSFA